MFALIDDRLPSKSADDIDAPIWGKPTLKVTCGMLMLQREKYEDLESCARRE